MPRSLLGTNAGAVCGLVAAIALSSALGRGAFLAVMAPGAVVLGGLLGWTVARLERRRLALALVLGVLCAFANAVVSGVLNAVAGNPCHIGAGAGQLTDGVAVGLIGAAILWWMILPAGLVAGAVVTLVTRRAPAKA